VVAAPAGGCSLVLRPNSSKLAVVCSWLGPMIEVAPPKRAS
jgi:hypothetical protein